MRIGIGYRVEAINPRRTRVSIMYSIDPKGKLAFFPSLAREYERRIVQSVLCLRTLVNQLPECAVLNLVESIIKSMRAEQEPDPLPSPDPSPEPSVTISSSLPYAPVEGPKENCWEDINGTIWKVRSSSYLQTREKTPSHPSICKVLSVDVFKSDSKLTHIAQHPSSALQQMKSLPEGVSRVLIVNLQLTGGVSIVCYLLVPEVKADDSPSSTLLQHFFTENDAWRNGRFKILPHIEEGGYLIKKAVGMTPCLIGNKGKSTYFSGDSPVPYFECDYDMDGSAMSRNLGRYLFASCDLVVDVGFVIQGETPEELPEQVLGAFRCHHLDLAKAQCIFIVC